MLTGIALTVSGAMMTSAASVIPVMVIGGLLFTLEDFGTVRRFGSGGAVCVLPGSGGLAALLL